MTTLTMPGPPPKTKPDPRQTLVREMHKQLMRNAKKDGSNVWVTNVVTGYYASKVDVDKIRTMIEGQLSHVTPRAVKQDWVVVRDWIETVVHHWAQRTKSYNVTLRGNKIAVRFETEDDKGRYKYAFDVLIGAGG